MARDYKKGTKGISANSNMLGMMFGPSSIKPENRNNYGKGCADGHERAEAACAYSDHYPRNPLHKQRSPEDYDSGPDKD